MTLRIHAQVNPAASLAPEFTAPRVAAALAELGDAVLLSHGSTPAEFEVALPQAEALFLTGLAPLYDLARRAPRLRWISYTSAGV